VKGAGSWTIYLIGAGREAKNKNGRWQEEAGRVSIDRLAV
jgi:hypothetical protein